MLKVGIVGLGKLGSLHLRIYKEIKEIDKIYLVDTDEAKLKAHSSIASSCDYRDLKGKIDLVSIASPTNTHYEIGRFFLENRIPILIEKPLTQKDKEAQELIEISKRTKTLLFVGHVERYNNAYLAAKEIITRPLFIECHRLSPYPYRSIETSVVLDLMIHDLDIILDIVKDKVKKIDAKGVKVISPSVDIANARITFEGGCVTNVTSSRISAKKERKIRIFMPNCYASLDYAEQTIEIYRKINNEIKKDVLAIQKEEPLKKEIADFVNLVKNKRFTAEYAQKAYDALKLACRIEQIIKR